MLQVNQNIRKSVYLIYLHLKRRKLKKLKIYKFINVKNGDIVKSGK